MPYTTEEAIETFWADHQGEASGRDPLAIQNSSVVIYAKMISGITNVTNRLRYNGFYCWLLDTIIKNVEPKNSLVEQVRYIRRGELLLAYMMVHNYPEVTGISGSAYARNHLDDAVNLKTGADWDTKTKDSPPLYWKFKSGAFGQYFIGVLNDLNLINHPGDSLNIYSLTDKGVEMADCFRKSLPEKEKRLFWKLVQNGLFDKNQLAKITSFAVTNIEEDALENTFYRNLLLGEDDRNVVPSYHRMNSIKLLLNYLDTSKDTVGNLPNLFLRYNYLNHQQQSILQRDTATGWYLYEINELLHVSFEHFHACFLNVLENYPTPVDEAIEKLVKAFGKACKQKQINPTATTVSDLLSTLNDQNLRVYESYDQMLTSFKEEAWGISLFNAVKVFLLVYRDSQKHLAQLKEYALMPENNFNRPGYANEIMEDLVELNFNLKLIEYIKKIVMLAINQHTFSSYRKSKIGQGLVHNYIVEDNLVWQLRQTLPNRTSPRLQNVTQYLIDIGWIRKKGDTIRITNSGKTVLKSL